MKDSHEVGLKECSEDGCKETYKPHYWGSIKANDKGWFQQKDGRSWCPKHTPSWVAEWRKRQNKDG